MTKKIITIGIVAICIILLVTGLRDNKPGVLPSVGGGDSYNYSTTTKNHAGTALTERMLKVGQGALSSVTITGAGAGVVTFYDATSSLPHPEYGTSTIATIPASAAAGTYTFDASFSRGLLYTISGTAPTSTITWR